jgi:hypothetical protein
MVAATNYSSILGDYMFDGCTSLEEVHLSDTT